MNKSRIVLLGALVSLLSLTGCGTFSGLVDTGKAWTAKLTGADDPNNKGLMATAGRANIAGIDAAAEVAGVKPEAAPAPAATPAIETPVVAVSTPASPAPAAAPAPTKKVAAKKPPAKDGTLKTVAVTTGGKGELPKVAKTDKSQ